MSKEEQQDRFIVNDGTDLPKLKKFLSGREYDTVKPLTDRIGNTMLGLRHLRDRLGKVYKNRGLIVVIDYDLDKEDPDVKSLLEEVHQLVDEGRISRPEGNRKLGARLHSDSP